MAEERVEQLSVDDQRYVDRARGEYNKDSVVDQHFQEDGTPVEAFKMPEKFEGKSAEDIAKAYTELEKLKAKQADSVNPDGVEDTKNTSETNEPPEDKKDATKPPTDLLTKKDFSKYEQSYVENGSLTEADYKELADRGLSQEIVDTYIENQKVKTEVYSSKLYEATGGEEGWTEMIGWARENLTQSQAARFDEAVKSGNLDTANYEIENVKLRMGKPPRRIEGQSAGVGGIKGYSNMTEYYSDMRNPAYKKDSKFRDMVDNKYLSFKGLL